MPKATPKGTPHPKTKKKPQQDGRRVQSWQNQILCPLGGWPTKMRTIIPKTFSQCCEGSEPHVGFPAWGPPGTLTLKPSGIWLQYFHRTRGNRGFPRLGIHTQNLLTPRLRKGAVTSQETEPKLPARVGGSPVDMCVSRGSPQGCGDWAASVWGAPLWCKPSCSSPLTWP